MVEQGSKKTSNQSLLSVGPKVVMIHPSYFLLPNDIAVQGKFNIN